MRRLDIETDDYVGELDIETDDYVGELDIETDDYVGELDIETDDYVGELDIETRDARERLQKGVGLWEYTRSLWNPRAGHKAVVRSVAVEPILIYLSG